eukprot:Awhi_evm1s15325
MEMDINLSKRTYGQIQQQYGHYQQDNKFEDDLSTRNRSNQFPNENSDTVQNQTGEMKSEPGNTAASYSNKSNNNQPQQRQQQQCQHENNSLHNNNNDCQYEQ